MSNNSKKHNRGELVSLISTIILISFCCCKDNNITNSESTYFLAGPWEINQEGNITLYSRPINYSSSASPNSNSIKVILKNQNDFIDEINNKLGVHFNKSAKIYLFNYDESMEKLGSNGGGRTDAVKREMYCTYYNIPFLDQVRNRMEYLGVHEMVHVVSINELGIPAIRLMSEGYAVALDGGYSTDISPSGEHIRKTIEGNMKFLAQNSKILPPNELVQDNNLEESLFYPQAGFFIDFLFKKYGINKINLLFTATKDNFTNEFSNVTGDNFNTIGNEYLSVCDSLK